MLKTILCVVPCVPSYLTPHDHAALEVAVPVARCVPKKSAKDRYRDKLRLQIETRNLYQTPGVIRTLDHACRLGLLHSFSLQALSPSFALEGQTRADGNVDYTHREFSVPNRITHLNSQEVRMRLLYRHDLRVTCTSPPLTLLSPWYYADDDVSPGGTMRCVYLLNCWDMC